MVTVAKLVTELFMMVLCVHVMPPAQQDLRIDVVDDRGYVDTMIVRNLEEGFAIYDGEPGKTDEIIRVHPVQGQAAEYTVVEPHGEKSVLRLAEVIPELAKTNFADVKTVDLKAKDSTVIKVRRSGSVVYLTPLNGKRTYVAHD